MQPPHLFTQEDQRASDLLLLSSRERRTLEGIFRHPTGHNLEWSHVLALLEKIGAVEQKAISAFCFSIGHERHIVHKPHTKDLPTTEIIDLRHFLARAGWSPEIPPPAKSDIGGAVPSLLVAIDHHGARLYRIDISSADAMQHLIEPYDPHHFLHHMRHKDESRERGQKQAEDNSYYLRIAEALAAAGPLVLVGHGTGASNAAQHLALYLREHHGEIYARVAAELTADLSALTDPQLLALGAQALGASRHHAI